jgi:hypothetical protein
MSWEDQDFNELLVLKPVINSNYELEEEVVDPDIVYVPKTVVRKDPEFVVNKDRDVISIYCSGAVAGNRKKGKTVISTTLLNNQGIVISDKSKYLGENIEPRELWFSSLTLGLQEAKSKGYTKAEIYSDYKLPNKSEILRFGYFSKLFEKDLNLIYKQFESVSINNIPRKLNIVTIRLAEELLILQSKNGKDAAKKMRDKRANEQAFANRFKK